MLDAEDNIHATSSFIHRENTHRKRTAQSLCVDSPTTPITNANVTVIIKESTSQIVMLQFTRCYSMARVNTMVPTNHNVPAKHSLGRAEIQEILGEVWS